MVLKNSISKIQPEFSLKELKYIHYKVNRILLIKRSYFSLVVGVLFNKKSPDCFHIIHKTFLALFSILPSLPLAELEGDICASKISTLNERFCKFPTINPLANFFSFSLYLHYSEWGLTLNLYISFHLQNSRQVCLLKHTELVLMHPKVSAAQCEQRETN